MLARRDLVTGGVLGGVLGALSNGEAAAASAGEQSLASEQQSLERIVRAIADLQSEVRDQRAFPEIAAIREAQKRHLRANSKLPDNLEVGIDVWFGVHDWHVRWQQPMAISRDPQGRLTIGLMQTLLIMRTDAVATFIGSPYDSP